MEWTNLLSFSERIPGVAFAHPEWLVLAPVGWVLSWWIARGALGGWQGRRHVLLLTVRCVTLAMLAIALADPSLKRTSKDVAVVVVRDVSRSIPASQQKLADEFVAASVRQKKASDYFGQVTAAQRSFVQAVPSAGNPNLGIGYVGEIEATDLQSGVELAKAMIPSESGGRILVLTDGNQTGGSLLSAARSAAAAKVPVDVASVEYDRTSMIRVRDLVVPAWARESEVISAKVVVESGRAAVARLSVLLDGEPVDLDPATDGLSLAVQVNKGTNLFTVPLQLPPGASHQIEAVLEVEGADKRAAAERDVPELLRAMGIVFTSARGRVLLLTESAQDLQPLMNAIGSEDISVEARSASMAPVSLAELAGFDAVILANESASGFSQAFQEDLVRYVHDMGGGLLVLGGPESFGAGGWIGSPVADALPVLLDPPQKRQLPMGALAIIIDQSGSMSSKVTGTTLDQQQIANEAAVLGVKTLSRLDDVAVIAFSDASRVVVPLTPCADAEGISRSIRSIGPMGGTNLFPAFRVAAAELAKSPAGVKHIIVLTDGETVGDPSEGLAIASRLRQQGVTMSTVAIGDSFNGDLLKRLAFVGGGRYYTVTSQNSMAVLPQIFIKEAQTVRRALIWEGPAFRPAAGVPSESLRGIDAPFPVMSGYVVTADRKGLASVLLRGPEDDPILAQWQHGLGRVTTYASDATSRWNPAWTAWPGFSAFWKQQIRWTMRPQGDPRARVLSETTGENGHLVVELFDDNSDPLSFAKIRGRIVHPSGLKSEDIEVRQTGPGRYESTSEIKAPGAHLATLRYDVMVDGQLRSGSLRAAIVRRAGEEMRRPTPDTEILMQVARESRGRIYTLDRNGADLWVREHLSMPESKRSVWLIVALMAVGAFLLDVAARRVSIDVRQVRTWGAGLVVPAAASKPASMAMLAKAKALATRERAPKDSTPGNDAGASMASRVVGPPVAPMAEAAEATPESSAGPQDELEVMDRLRAAKKRGKSE